VKVVRREFPDKIIIAGNVATNEMTEALILAGADIVKVGIGPGSVCTTRKVAGVGYPQLSAIAECADAAHGLGGHVMADGGCNSPGDIAKAFAAGADFVMLGGMFAGHDESGGDLVESDDGQLYKSFHGMSSSTAMERHYGEIAKHRAPEGKAVSVPYRGPLSKTVQSILGGVRSSCSYVGARRIKDLPKCTTFIRVTQTTNEVYRGMEIDG
ncbi:MAG: IMP dehydrogenase, partial [Candidatus Thalassarchaeaceae archaeon]